MFQPTFANWCSTRRPGFAHPFHRSCCKTATAWLRQVFMELLGVVHRDWMRLSQAGGWCWIARCWSKIKHGILSCPYPKWKNRDRYHKSTVPKCENSYSQLGWWPESFIWPPGSATFDDTKQDWHPGPAGDTDQHGFNGKPWGRYFLFLHHCMKIGSKQKRQDKSKIMQRPKQWRPLSYSTSMQKNMGSQVASVYSSNMRQRKNNVRIH